MLSFAVVPSSKTFEEIQSDSNLNELNMPSAKEINESSSELDSQVESEEPNDIGDESSDIFTQEFNVSQ